MTSATSRVVSRSGQRACAGTANAPSWPSPSPRPSTGSCPRCASAPRIGGSSGALRAKLHVALTRPAPPAAVQSLDAAFWTWTASGRGGAPATVAASFAGGLAAAEALEALLGPRRWVAALRELRPELALAENAVVTRWWNDEFCDGSYACHPPGWSQRDDEEVAAPYGRIHLAGEHTAAEFTGTLEGALRSGARAAAEVLAERAQGAVAH